MCEIIQNVIPSLLTKLVREPLLQCSLDPQGNQYLNLLLNALLIQFLEMMM